ncbi:MAG: branched-chain amino acid ABC transporter permease [Actinobacteria bacterium]|jgi:branched-chain amino acid transport system permease protein|nr:branched-chain amino acid ABC transporter permease [Actinomycetota bacterium]MCL6094926.1 branched-chain amino acid ABC transporter permease [Actinomycetota bacterium]
MSALGDLVNAISLGVIYAVVAVSVGLVFGVLRQVNLAQGEIIAFGAYSLWLTRTWPIVLSFLLCCLICIGMSLAMQIAIFRPLRGASALTTLIVTFGLSYALEAVWLMVFGPNGQPVSRLSILNNTVLGGHVDIRWVTFAEIGIGGLFFVLLLTVLYRTKVGAMMRATAEDYKTARLIGVRIEQVVTVAFVFGGLSAAIVAILATVQTPLVTPDFGFNLIVVALVGVVLGGIDSLGKATAGGFVVGFVNSLLGAVIPEQQLVFLPTLTFLFVILVLLLRPAGLFVPNRASVERV